MSATRQQWQAHVPMFQAAIADRFSGHDRWRRKSDSAKCRIVSRRVFEAPPKHRKRVGQVRQGWPSSLFCRVSSLFEVGQVGQLQNLLFLPGEPGDVNPWILPSERPGRLQGSPKHRKKVDQVDKVGKVQSGWQVECGRVFEAHRIQRENRETQRLLNRS